MCRQIFRKELICRGNFVVAKFYENEFSFHLFKMCGHIFKCDEFEDKQLHI